MSSPALARLRAAVADRFDPRSPATFWELEPAVREFVASPGMSEYLNGQLDYLHEKHETPPELGLAAGVRFAVGGVEPCLLSLDVVRRHPSPPVLHSSASDRLIGFVVGKPLRFDYYEQERPDPVDVFDAGRTLTARPAVVLDRERPVLSQRATRDLLQPTGDPEDGDVLVATLQSPARAAVLWEYDAVDLVPHRLIASDTGSTRLCYIASLLAQMGARQTLPNLRRLARHDNYTVRWTAIRAITTLDPEAGIELVREATSDPHPHIRAAATRALARQT